MRSLVSGGVLVREGERWAVNATVETVSLPPTLHGLLLSRVDKLPADTRRVLQAAAVLGVSFDEALLHAVARRRAGRLAAPGRRRPGAPRRAWSRRTGTIASATRCCTTWSTTTS